MSFLKKIIEIGILSNLSLKEQKRVRLLNVMAVLMFVVNLLLGIFVVVLNYEVEVAYVHFIVVPFSLLVLYLQFKHRYFLARIAIWVLSFSAIYYFSFFGDTSVNNEYYFALMAILPLIFFDHKWIHWLALGLSCLGFMSMDFYYLSQDLPVKHMNNSSFVLFTLIFLVVNFFKNLNEKQEQLMLAQRDSALQKNKIIESQKKELEELNRFQSKFFINISHELRTPLTLIGGAASQLNKSEENKKQVESIVNQSDKIKQIVDDILDITKSKFNKLELNVQVMDFSMLVTKIKSSFQSAFEDKNIELEQTGCLNDIVKIKGDVTYLERAINNILLNALKYTSEGVGNVNLHLSVNDESTAELKITDNGIGVKKEDLEKVFERFYQGENHINKSGGTGIGLSFSQDIIRLHHGEISIESELNVGTQAKIVLPLEEFIKSNNPLDTEGSQSSESDTSVFKSSDKTTILVVDDHADMRSYISSLLQNFNVLEAKDGQEGLTLLEKNRIDFIVTDFMMPVMDGLEFVKEIKSRKIDTPILVLTARTDLEGKLDILRLGVDDYISKPFNQEELLIRINNSLKNYKERKRFIEEEQVEEIIIEDPFIVELRDFIVSRIDDTDFGLDDICIEMAVSTSSLYRKIKSTTGLSSNEFVREIKLIKARDFVEQKKAQSLKELSFMVGFSKPSYFGSLYEKRFGKKPF